MLEYNEVKISRILNPTAIDLGEYVINPFMGCEFACLYCYVRSNRVVSRKNKPWGEYVDIRINAPELLLKEIQKKKPGQVLLGSTTDCFQPIERKYRITQRLLEILNANKINYVILCRSPYILDCLPLLKQGYCQKIYFSINNYALEYKSRLEPKSPGFSSRVEAVNTMLQEGINVIPYFSPILPWISDISGIFSEFPRAGCVEFECLNFNLQNISDIIEKIGEVDPGLKPRYQRMLAERSFYSEVWRAIEDDIRKAAREANKKYNIYIHQFGGYFNNTYG